MRPRHTRRGDSACHFGNNRRALADNFRALRDEGSGFMTRTGGICATESCKLFSHNLKPRCERFAGLEGTRPLAWVQRPFYTITGPRSKPADRNPCL